jgi:hypothetical protein
MITSLNDNRPVDSPQGSAPAQKKFDSETAKKVGFVALAIFAALALSVAPGTAMGVLSQSLKFGLIAGALGLCIGGPAAKTIWEKAFPPPPPELPQQTSHDDDLDWNRERAL